jgi:hypothetical protein
VFAHTLAGENVLPEVLSLAGQSFTRKDALLELNSEFFANRIR